MKTREFEELGVNVYKERTRAFIKIQEGCNQFCTYCIIPYARGPVRSRSEENILKEVSGLAHSGYKEVVLTGYLYSISGLQKVNDAITETTDEYGTTASEHTKEILEAFDALGDISQQSLESFKDWRQVIQHK